MTHEAQDNYRASFRPASYVPWIMIGVLAGPTLATLILLLLAMAPQTRADALWPGIGALNAAFLSVIVWGVVLSIPIRIDLSDEAVRLYTLVKVVDMPWAETEVFLSEESGCEKRSHRFVSVAFRSHKGAYVSKAISFRTKSGVELPVAVKELCDRIGKTVVIDLLSKRTAR